MQRRKPVIGLSVGYHDFGDYQGVGFQRPLALAGGIPLILTRAEDTIDDQLSVVDGVVIGGGRDIEPHRYGQEPTDKMGEPDPHRDEFELDLVRRALDHDLPILGMCRGSQVVNVALGGTLVQDVSLVPEWEAHPTDRGWHRWKAVESASLNAEQAVPEHPRHAISVEQGSRLHEALGADEVEVNSFHHQAVERLAPGLKATGRAPDGVVEVLELDSEDGYLLAAQFELQEEWRIDGRFLEIFRQFVRAAETQGAREGAAQRTAKPAAKARRGRRPRHDQR